MLEVGPLRMVSDSFLCEPIRLTSERKCNSIEIDESDEYVSARRAYVSIGKRGNDIDRYVAKTGKESADDEELSSSDLIDAEATSQAAEEGEYGVEGVQKQLLSSSGDADVL